MGRDRSKASQFRRDGDQMRAVLMGDIIATARALLAVRPEDRAGVLAVIFCEAHAAHHFYKRKGRPHPEWGNGSLMARANLCVQQAEPFAGQAEYLDALHLVISGLRRRYPKPG